MWQFPSVWDPSFLYVFKAGKSGWSLYHYEYYTYQRRPGKKYREGPVVDSVVMESLSPQHGRTWERYISELGLDSLWFINSESQILKREFNIIDGSRNLIEIRDGEQYRYIFQTTPYYFADKDEDHARSWRFHERLKRPVIYDGMRNP